MKPTSSTDTTIMYSPQRSRIFRTFPRCSYVIRQITGSMGPFCFHAFGGSVRWTKRAVPV